MRLMSFGSDIYTCPHLLVFSQVELSATGKPHPLVPLWLEIAAFAAYLNPHTFLIPAAHLTYYAE